MKRILDASALIAFLGMEEGAHVVRRLRRDNPGLCFVHALNLCEVYYHVVRVRDAIIAQRTLHLLKDAGVATREDMDTAFWQDAGQLKASFRRISLADCFCLALARRMGGEVLTADHHEFDPLAAQGICPIHFIR